MTSAHLLCPSHRRETRTLAASTLVTLLIIVACSPSTAPTTTTPLSLTRFRAESVAYLSISGYDQPSTFVVRDRATWESTWNQIHRRHSPIPPLPDIDFSAEMVGVAALGGQPNSGYDLVLTNASESGGTVTVEATTRSPAPQCVILPVVTSPVDLARLPRREGPVLFRLIPSTSSCS
jgi:hypothetical protein